VIKLETLGFIGIGDMGRPMVKNLIRGKRIFYVYDVIKERSESLAETGAIVCQDIDDLARKSEIIFIMVRTETQVKNLLFNKDGIVNSLQPGTIIVCMSTMSPHTSKNIASRLKSKNIDMLDAPVSGGIKGAEKATLAIMVGGKQEIFQRILPYFKLMGQNVSFIGEYGSGQAAKAANQVIVTLTRAAVGEALLLAIKNGANPETVRRALTGGLADSTTLQTYGSRIAKKDEPVEFDSPILRKDMNMVVKTAEKLGLDLPFSRLLQRMYNRAVK
jgi:2-hydroxy-3-oxopropionate reductase